MKGWPRQAALAEPTAFRVQPAVGVLGQRHTRGSVAFDRRGGCPERGLLPRQSLSRIAIGRRDKRGLCKSLLSEIGRAIDGQRRVRAVQTPADHLGDLLERHALFADGIDGASFRAALKRKPEAARRVEARARRARSSWVRGRGPRRSGGGCGAFSSMNSAGKAPSSERSRQRRSRPHGGGQAHMPSGSRPARVRIFGLCGRWPAGPQHGGYNPATAEDAERIKSLLAETAIAALVRAIEAAT
jgi:hypothetical protein